MLNQSICFAFDFSAVCLYCCQIALKSQAKQMEVQGFDLFCAVPIQFQPLYPRDIFHRFTYSAVSLFVYLYIYTYLHTHYTFTIIYTVYSTCSRYVFFILCLKSHTKPAQGQLRGGAHVQTGSGPGRWGHDGASAARAAQLQARRRDAPGGRMENATGGMEHGRGNWPGMYDDLYILCITICIYIYIYIYMYVYIDCLTARLIDWLIDWLIDLLNMAISHCYVRLPVQSWETYSVCWFHAARLCERCRCRGLCLLRGRVWGLGKSSKVPSFIALCNQTWHWKDISFTYRMQC